MLAVGAVQHFGRDARVVSSGTVGDIPLRAPRARARNNTEYVDIRDASTKNIRYSSNIPCVVSLVNVCLEMYTHVFDSCVLEHICTVCVFDK